MIRSNSGRMMRSRVAAGALVWLTSLLFCSTALAQVSPAICGNPFENHFGPWDYRTARRADIEIVEKAHFTPGVESMTVPKNTMRRDMAQDVGYTLHVFPNHHRALVTMARLGERYGDPPPGTRGRSVECYFDRAVRFRPDDSVARSLYAQFLGKQGRKDEAVKQLEFTLKNTTDNPISQYTIGTVFLELGEFERALIQAHKAREMGVQWPELEQALKSSGHWRDPEK